ncbi:SWI/SNF-related matrix-associated actin-dependent regulator of chromatin subfamily A-like protein 1 isoform X2 [Macrosteles quadrilineatus]|uniref:SWI/SNF-related matrix-associated actin-dependent regulator of chromatin subfamily A-like protein 1 isoform X2 n=1 Tax=Macrosteles quadrilineatus TaxID=74068 RepID=UPI0023E0D065|nr:SWI/SNF-related matrix-associated actin-dependent regulator of chromatin subfamily A-like protein 1 isoform X2 [Macrosteles quadrilineatus]
MLCLWNSTTKMSSSLTPEQRARIEQNRRLALEKRAARLAAHLSPEKRVQLQSSTLSTSVPSFKTQPVNSSTINQHATQNLNSNLNHNASNASSTVVKSFKLNQPNTPGTLQKTMNSGLFYKYTPPGSKYPSLNLTKSNKTTENPPQLNPTVSGSSVSIPAPGPRPQTRVTGECRLVSKERFTVDITFHQHAIDIFRTINGKEYDFKSKLWTFPVTEYFNLKKAVSVLTPDVIIGNLPKCVIETFITKAKNYQTDISKVDISRVDSKLKDAIYPFQKQGIQFGVTRGGRCLVADDMGLGKSIQALGIADYYRDNWPLLIVCPSSMRYQWEEEVRVRLPNSVHPHQIFVMTTGKDVVEGARVLILSYDLLAKKKDLIKEMQFGVVIMDESHIIKSVKTQRGKAALEVAEHCRRVILLSGTPVLSRPQELYNQIKAIDPAAFPYFKEFGIRYCNGVQNKFGWDFSGSSNMEELRILLETRMMIRRMKSEVLSQLPGKIRQVITLNSKSLSTKNNDSMDAFALKLQSSTLKGRERHGCLLQYFSETAKTKASAVCEYIEDVLQDNRKFLCFAHHGDMLEAICQTLENNKTWYIRIDGSVSAEERKQLCDKFQYEDKWMVAVLSIKAANTGLTLTAAQMVIFAELFWNPGDLAQAEDRVHRIGQEDCVVVKYLIARGTADDYLWPLVQSKLEVLNRAGLSKDSYMDADHTCLKGSPEKKESQTKINDYFQNDDDDDDEMLLSMMDEVEGVVEKKIKLG